MEAVNCPEVAMTMNGFHGAAMDIDSCRTNRSSSSPSIDLECEDLDGTIPAAQDGLSDHGTGSTLSQGTNTDLGCCDGTNLLTNGTTNGTNHLINGTRSTEDMDGTNNVHDPDSTYLDPQQTQTDRKPHGLTDNINKGPKNLSKDADGLTSQTLQQTLREARGNLVHNLNHNNNMTGSAGDRLLQGGTAAEVEDLASRLSQMQSMLEGLRGGFETVMEAFTKIQYEDRVLEEKVESNNVELQQQLTDVVQMVLAGKTEFGGVVSQLTLVAENERNLRAQVELLRFERDILLEELERTGAISDSVRQKFHSGKSRPNGLTRANNSTLSLLLERARTAFGTNSNSDHDSGLATNHQGDTSTCGEVTPPGVSPIVQSYIAGLPSRPHDIDPPADENYDSDSSIVAAANKSLDMSRSLGDRCAEITQLDSSDEEADDGVDNDQNHEGTEKSNGILPTALKRPPTPEKTPPHNTREFLRLRVMRELLETERKYCSSLWTILDHFANRLREAAIVPAKESSVMFPASLRRMYEHHCAFLQKLEESVANWRRHGIIGDMFASFIDSNNSDVLTQYRAYVTEFPAALRQLKKSCRSSVRFKNFLRKCQQDTVCGGLDLAAFLLTPVQRVPRYVLLLKQMLKFTSEEHIDHYYLDVCLSKLGAFLSQLNDSIEYSMKVVAADNTPKIKRRKLRVGSVRSSSSSCDGMQLSSATKDSGIQSPGDNLSLVSTSSNGRMFQMSVSKDPDRSLGVPADSLSQSDKRSLNIAKSIHSRAQNWTLFDSRTLPSIGTRRKGDRFRRPKSGDARSKFTVETPDGRTEEATTVPRRALTRPLSAVEPGSVSLTESFRSRLFPKSRPTWKSQQGAAQVYEEEDDTGDVMVSQRRTGSPACLSQRGHPSGGSTNSAGGFLHSSYLGTSLKSLPDSALRDHCHDNTPKPITTSDVHHSLMHIPDEYGIYGNQDSLTDETAYTPSVVGVTQRAGKLAYCHRSRSQGHLPQQAQYQPVPPGGSTIVSPSPSQQRVNLALARSLADERATDPNYSQYSQQGTPSNGTHLHQSESSHSHPADTTSVSTPYHQVASVRASSSPKPRPKSCVLSGGDSPGSARLTADYSPNDMDRRVRSNSIGPQSSVTQVSKHQDIPDRPRENVWHESTLDDSSMLSVSDLGGTGRRKDVRRKKKDRQKKQDESLMEGVRRKTGFRDSIKNIFFKKRKPQKEKEKMELNTLKAGDDRPDGKTGHDVTLVMTPVPVPVGRPVKAPTPAPQGQEVTRDPKGHRSGPVRRLAGRAALVKEEEDEEMVGEMRRSPAGFPRDLYPARSHPDPRRGQGSLSASTRSAYSSIPVRRPPGDRTELPAVRGKVLRSRSAPVGSNKVVEIGSGTGQAEDGDGESPGEETGGHRWPPPALSPLLSGGATAAADPQADGGVISTSVIQNLQRDKRPELGTYEDENGDPCSAV